MYFIALTLTVIQKRDRFDSSTLVANAIPHASRMSFWMLVWFRRIARWKVAVRTDTVNIA